MRGRTSRPEDFIRATCVWRDLDPPLDGIACATIADAAPPPAPRIIPKRHPLEEPTDPEECADRSCFGGIELGGIWQAVVVRIFELLLN